MVSGSGVVDILGKERTHGVIILQEHRFERQCEISILPDRGRSSSLAWFAKAQHVCSVPGVRSARCCLCLIALRSKCRFKSHLPTTAAIVSHILHCWRPRGLSKSATSRGIHLGYLELYLKPTY